MTFDHEQMRNEIGAKRQILLGRQKEIEREKVALEQEALNIQQQLVGLDYMLEGLQFMVTGGPPPDLEQLGFTDKVALIFEKANTPLFPTQVRDELLQIGVKGSSTKNLLISVHNAINRLLQDSLQEIPMEGRSAYKWKEGAPSVAVPLRRRTFADIVLANEYAPVDPIGPPPPPGGLRTMADTLLNTPKPRKKLIEQIVDEGKKK